MKKVVLISTVLAFYLQANEVKNLNDMTVTAQKTEESVQDVPIAMSVFDDVSLEDKEINNLNDLVYFVPSFYMLNPGDEGAYAPSMRGIIAPPETMSSSVGLYVDGVAITSSYGYEAILEDAQRVEVLRGPQGTLYGKNSEAGVINVVSKKPTNNTEGKISLEYGEDNKQEVFVAIRMPIIKDKLFVGITSRYYSKDGNMENTFLNEDYNDRKNYFGKIYLRATPTDRLEMSLIASKYKRDDGVASLNSIQAPDVRKIAVDKRGFEEIDDDIYAFKLNYDFDNFTLSSTTSYNKWVIDSAADMDFTPQTKNNVQRYFEDKTLSEELKFDGEYKKLKWLFGLYVSGNEFEGGLTYPLMNYKTYVEGKNRNLGIFTHLNYAFSDKLNLIGGIRYDRDKSEFDDKITMENDEKTSSNISPKIALEYKWNKDFMTYASIAKGYKAGGFFSQAPQGYSKSYDSESLWNYELGFKSTMLDGKLALNADIYYMDISDMQVFMGIDALNIYVSNAASATSYGFEFDTNYMINDNFNIFATFGYNETKFDEFKDALGDYKDNYNPFTPKYNYSLGGVFRAFGGFYTSANVTGYGKMYIDKANNFKQDSYAVVNAKIGYEWKNFDIYLYADNLFDKNYDLVGYYGYYTLVNPDREVGVKFTYRF